MLDNTFFGGFSNLSGTWGLSSTQGEASSGGGTPSGGGGGTPALINLFSISKDPLLNGVIWDDNVIFLRGLNLSPTGTPALVLKKDGTNITFTIDSGMAANHTVRDEGIVDIVLTVPVATTYDATATYTAEYTTSDGTTVTTTLTKGQAITVTKITATGLTNLTLGTEALLLDFFIVGGGGSSFTGRAGFHWTHGGAGGNILQENKVLVDHALSIEVRVGTGGGEGTGPVGQYLSENGNTSSVTIAGTAYSAAGGVTLRDLVGGLSYGGGNHVTVNRNGQALAGIPATGFETTGQIYSSGGEGRHGNPAAGGALIDTAAAANTGGGGGAGDTSGIRHAGGSGVVFVRERSR